MDPNQNNNMPETDASPMGSANSTPETNPQPEMGTPAPKKSGGIGPMVGAIIVIGILIVGALYYFGNNASEFLGLDTNDGSNDAAEISEDVDMAATEADAEMEGIEADLDASVTDLDESF